MSKIIFVLTLAVILALSYLALENPSIVELKFFHKGPAEVPLYMVIFGAFILGALFVYVLFLLQGVRGALLGMRQKRIKMRDEKTETHRQEARTQRRLGHLEKSKDLLKKANHLVPENLELSLDLADALLEGKEYVEASERYHRVFSRDSQNTRAVLGIAASNEGVHNFSEAELYYRRVLDMDRANTVALQGLLRTQTGQGKWPAAVETLRLLKKEGLVSTKQFGRQLARLWYEQGRVDQGTGDLKGSIASLEKALKAQNDFVPALLNLGEVHIRDGSPDRAVKIWENALMDRFQLPVARALEKHMMEHGGEKELLHFYRKISDEHKLAKLLLARLYLRQDMVEEAEAAVKDMPDMEASPGALLVLAEVEKKRLNEALSNRHYSLAFEILHPRSDVYQCADCGTFHDQWTPQCPNCGEWSTLEAKQFLP
jgi:tetratricopeptide (TPR) repeat protein